jgi:hypothetical protein
LRQKFLFSCTSSLSIQNAQGLHHARGHESGGHAELSPGNQDEAEPRHTTGKPASVEPLPSKTTQTEQPGSAGKISLTSTVAGDDPEAHRIAGELVKLHRDGAISGPDDPEAHFFASLLHAFGATYNGKGGT